MSFKGGISYTIYDTKMIVPDETFYFLLGYFIRNEWSKLGRENLDRKAENLSNDIVNMYWGFIIWRLFFENEVLKKDKSN